jgi:hypothetical protein
MAEAVALPVRLERPTSLLTVRGAPRLSEDCDKGFVAAIRHGVKYGLIEIPDAMKGYAREHRDPPLENPR